MASQRPAPELDFLSPPDVFDPQLLLASLNVPVPFNDIRPLDNLSKCVSLLPGAAPAAGLPKQPHRRPLQSGQPPPSGKQVLHTRGAAEAECHGSSLQSATAQAGVDQPLPMAFGASGMRGARGASKAPSRRRQSSAESADEPRKSLARQWAETFQGDGPLGESGLARWRSRRVRVVVRRQFGLRGWYEGELRTYDRHWNMLLTNVAEHAVVVDQIAASTEGLDAAIKSGRPSQASPRRDSDSPRWLKQSIPQLLLRGDCVVSVCDARKAANAWRAQGGESGRFTLPGCTPSMGMVGGTSGTHFIAAFERLAVAAINKSMKGSNLA
eukprot:scaffold245959_cov32-Tisochrysis_lutea.AAC.1